MKKCLFVLSLFYSFSLSAQESAAYEDTYNYINKMLSGEDSLNFKKAVFITENAYFENQLNEEEFDNFIRFYASFCRGIMASGNVVYKETDVERATAQCAVFVFMTDSLPVSTNDGIFIHTPFEYNFDDFAGQKEWSNMFVSTLMETKKGNCHSLPFLYKIIMDELKQDAYLSLAPNHIYIKVQNKRAGWYNIELTCGDFPTDAWLMSSGYIHIDALRNGIYMDTLSLKQSVALCLVDLAHGYRAKFGLQNGNFILQCCETALSHFPNYINALLLKAETLADMYKQSVQGLENTDLLNQMNELYAHIHHSGYRKMPQNMYLNWLNSMGIETTNYRVKSLIVNKDDL
ncbi:MAG: hypothetical protein LBS69_12660 [Prevotellaceae bacterium]|jgi:hypothetical protein|nr:hypothetical protein [Prevotellaceae bacterium]